MPVSTITSNFITGTNIWESHAVVTQLGECCAEDADVAGSSPAHGTCYYNLNWISDLNRVRIYASFTRLSLSHYQSNRNFRPFYGGEEFRSTSRKTYSSLNAWRERKGHFILRSSCEICSAPAVDRSVLCKFICRPVSRQGHGTKEFLQLFPDLSSSSS